MAWRRGRSPGPRTTSSIPPSAAASSPPRRSRAWARRRTSLRRFTSWPSRLTSPGRSSRSTAAARSSSRRHGRGYTWHRIDMKLQPILKRQLVPLRDPRKDAYEEAKLAKRIRRQVGEAISDFAMIAEGDRVMVCLSGGKDSHGMLDVLLSLQEKAPVRFELVAVNLDQKQPGFPAHVLPEYLAARGVPFRIVEQDTYSVVKRVIPEGKTYCAV